MADIPNTRVSTENQSFCCRACLKRTGTVPLFGDKENPDISLKITLCSGIKISKNDEFPKFICKECYNLLETAFTFRKSCEYSEKQLKMRKKIRERIQDTNAAVTIKKLEISDQDYCGNINSYKVCYDNKIKIEIVPDESFELCKNESNKENYENFTETFEMGEKPNSETINNSREPKDSPIHKINFDTEFTQQEEYFPTLEKNSNIVNSSYDGCHNIKKEEDMLSEQNIVFKPSYTCNIKDMQNKNKFQTLKSLEGMTIKNYTPTKHSNTTKDDFNKSKVTASSAFKKYEKKSLEGKIMRNCTPTKHSSTNKDDFTKSKITLSSAFKKHKKDMQPKDFLSLKSLEGMIISNCTSTKHSDNTNNEFNKNNAVLKIHKPKKSKVKLESNTECPQCKKEIKISKLKRHITKAHGGGKVECPICNKITTKRYLRTHEATYHNPTLGKYICEKCGKSFVLLSKFKYHCLSHTNEFPHKCDLCPYKSRNKELLVVHIRSHYVDKPYKCDQCNHGCSTKSNLNAHIRRRHRGPIDFICDTCKKGFYTKLDLVEHISAIHYGARNHICSTCGAAYGYRTYLLKHQRIVHKAPRPLGRAVYLRLAEKDAL